MEQQSQHKRRPSVARMVVLAALAGLLSACGGGGDDPDRLPDEVSTSGQFIAYVMQVIDAFGANSEPLGFDGLDAPTSERHEPEEV